MRILKAITMGLVISALYNVFGGIRESGAQPTRSSGDVVDVAAAAKETAAPTPLASGRAGLHRVLQLSQSVKNDARVHDWVKSQRDVDALKTAWRSERARIVATAHGSRYAYSIDQNLTGISNAVLGRNSASVVQIMKMTTMVEASVNDLLEKKWDLL